MAITLRYDAAPTLIGPAAFDIGRAEGLRQQQEAELRERMFQEERRQFDLGQGLRNRQLDQQFGERRYEFDVEQEFRQGQQAEQSRQFDAGQGIREEQLGLSRQELEFNAEQAKHRAQLAKFGMMQEGARDSMRLAEVDMRGQYGLASEAMGNDARLQLEQMQQQGLGQRQGQQMQGQMGMQWQAQAAKQMQADWQNVQNALPRLDPNEREELIDKFYERWQNSNVPMPVELPTEELPEWMDQNKQWEKANAWQEQQRELGNDVLLIPDDNGMPSIPRGWPQFPSTPEGMRQKNEAEMQKEQFKTAAKDEAAEAKMYRDAVHDQQVLQSKQASDQADAVTKYMDQQIKLQDQINDSRARLQKAKLDDASRRAKAKASAVGVEGYVEPPATDWTQQENDIALMESTLKSLSAPPGQTQQQPGGLQAPPPMLVPGQEPPQNQDFLKQQWESTPINGTISIPGIGPVKKTGPKSYVRL